MSFVVKKIVKYRMIYIKNNMIKWNNFKKTKFQRKNQVLINNNNKVMK